MLPVRLFFKAIGYGEFGVCGIGVMVVRRSGLIGYRVLPVRERWENGDMMMNTCNLLISAMYDRGEMSRDL